MLGVSAEISQISGVPGLGGFANLFLFLARMSQIMHHLASLLIPQEIFTSRGTKVLSRSYSSIRDSFRLFLVKSHFFVKTMACAILAQICDIRASGIREIGC